MGLRSIRISSVMLSMAVLAACGDGNSHVTAVAKGISVSGEETKPAFVFIPNLFTDKRVEFQSNSVLVLSADAAVAEGKRVTRVLNSTTSLDLISPDIFESSLATRVPLGAKDIRDRFVYGDNIVRLEMADALGAPSYAERPVILRDFSVGSPMINSGVMSGHSAGQVDVLTSPVLVGDGAVLTTSFVPLVYQ